MRKNKNNQLNNNPNDYSPPTNIPKTIKKVGAYQNSPSIPTYQKQQVENKGKDVRRVNTGQAVSVSTFNTFSMEEQIKKMRNNQISFVKAPTK